MENVDPATGYPVGRWYESAQTFWWYDRNLKRSGQLVMDGDPEPKFELEEAPFEIVAVSEDELEIKWSNRFSGRFERASI